MRIRGLEVYDTVVFSGCATPAGRVVVIDRERLTVHLSPMGYHGYDPELWVGPVPMRCVERYNAG